jgi:hypothetical protein
MDVCPDIFNPLRRDEMFPAIRATERRKDGCAIADDS